MLWIEMITRLLSLQLLSLKFLRSSSEDILAAQISFSLPEAFVLREQDGLNHYCEVSSSQTAGFEIIFP